MIDPWTIIGTTSAVLSFAEFAIAIVKTAVDINKSEDGASEDNKRLSEMTRNGQELLSQMTEFKTSQAGKSTLAPAEESMLATAEQCRQLGDKIMNFLSKMQTTKEDSLRASLKAAAKEVWYKNTVKGLDEQLQGCRTQLNSHMLVLIRSEIGKDFEQLLIMHSTQTDDIFRLHSLVERLSQNQDLMLNQIRQIAEIFAKPDPILKDINRNRILKGLEFDQIDARHDQISQAAHDTFGWCISDETVPGSQGDLEISLRQWLQAGQGIFHISAKPGGGKSTLMKMLQRLDSTDSLLKIWAADKILVKAKFFVWKAGVPLQKTVQGMIRTLLLQVLQQAPDLTQTLFMKYWKPHDLHPYGPMNAFKISLNDINDAFQRLMTDPVIAEQYRFCFFVDGLDEFEDQELKHSEVAEYLRQWVSHNPAGIKFCVSSREEPAFMNTFTAKQRLRLHLLTRPDIEAMVNNRLMKHPQFREYESVDRQKFTLAVVSRAEGVFLWVHLLIKNEIWDALDEGATVEDLFSLIHKVPEELEQFFTIITNSIRKSNKTEAAMIFAVAIQTDGWSSTLHAFDYSFLEDFLKDPNFSFTVQWQSSDKSDMKNSKENVERIARFKRRLPGLCKGLLELGQDDNLGFAHRSIYDFLKTESPDSVKATIMDTSASTSFLIQCLTAEIKCIDVESTSRRSRYLGYVMGILSSSSFAIQPFFTHLKHLEEVLALHQSGLPLTDPKSMFHEKFSGLATSGDSDGYLSVYAFAYLWQLRMYLEWAQQNYPSWILGEQVGSQVYGAAVRCELTRRNASIVLMLGTFLDPNENYPSGNKRGKCTRWMRFIKEALLYEWIILGDSGFWPTFFAFLENGADPLVQFRWQWTRQNVSFEFRMQSGVEIDTMKFHLDKMQGSRSFLRSFGASGETRADLVDFVRHFAPPNMDEIIGIVQDSMKQACGSHAESTEVVETRFEAADTQDNTRWPGPLAWLPKRIWDRSKPLRR